MEYDPLDDVVNEKVMGHQSHSVYYEEVCMKGTKVVIFFV